ncbi:MAG: hypothetical protein RL226_1851 [Bacteroidota bacterium]
MTIALAQALGVDRKVAILSRGYGRKTSGFLKINRSTLPHNSGDEPLLYTWRTEATVAVCEDRLEGIRRLTTDAPDVVLLDDALQHRRLRGTVNIALIHGASLPYHDQYLPVGRLRDHRRRLRQADIVVITNSAYLPESERKQLKNRLAISSDTPIFMSDVAYGAPYDMRTMTSTAYPKKLLLITGIANPSPLVDYLNNQCQELEHLAYRDHYAFQFSDIAAWKKKVAEGFYPITTEKDAMRLLGMKEAIDFDLLVVPMETRVENFEKLLNKINELLASRE